MKATITAVEFDFTSEDAIEEMPSLDEQQKIISSVLGKEYEVEDEDEIADAISDDTGWLVKSLDYDLENEQQPYGFYVDQQCTIWYRTRFRIMADSQEHANELAKKLFADGGISGIEEKLDTNIIDTEQLWDTVEPMEVEELFSDNGDQLATL